MKILVISATFPPRKFGGITEVSYNVSKKLAGLGHDVTVYTTDLGNYPNSRLKTNNVEFNEGMTIHYFQNLDNYIAFKHRLFLPIKMMLKLRDNINKYDIIHLHDFRSILSIFVYHYAKKQGIPYVLQAHGSVPYLSQKEFFKKVFDKLWGHKILNNASKVIAITETELEQYKKMDVSEDKIEIVPNGINLSEFKNLPEKGEFKIKYGITKNERIILYLGRLYKSKGVDILIKSFSEIMKGLNNVKLVIVGPDDGALDDLKGLSSILTLDDNILFTGPLYKRDKMAAYVDADVFVTPSFSGFPLTFLESCICGTPIITTNNGDKIKWINDIGYAVDFDINEIKDSIIKLLNDNEQRLEFGEKAKILVHDNFDWKVISKKIEDVYISILNKS